MLVKKMKTIALVRFGIFGILLGLLVGIQSCAPDRMPPAPTEFSRPEFIRFDDAVDSAFAVPVDQDVAMIFNEPMNLKTFQNGFTLYAFDHEVTGSFSAENFDETVNITDDSTAEVPRQRVVFRPDQPLKESRIYTVKLNNLIRDDAGNDNLRGNQITLDSTWTKSTYFFSEGDYSQNGAYQLAVLEDRNDAVLVYDGYKTQTDSTGGFSSPADILSFGEGDNAYVLVSERTASSTIAFYSVTQKSVTDRVEVGVGAEQLVSDGSAVYCALTSEEAITKISNVGGGNDTLHYVYSDYSVRNIAVGNDRLYISSDDNNNPGEVRILSVSDLSPVTSVTIDTILSDRRTNELVVSPDGQYLFASEERTNLVGIWDLSSNEFETRIQLPTERNQAMTAGSFAGDDFVLVANSSGWIYKIDAAGLMVTDSLHVSEHGIEDFALTPQNELAFVSVPDDEVIYGITTKPLKIVKKMPATPNMEVFTLVNRKTGVQ